MKLHKFPAIYDVQNRRVYPDFSKEEMDSKKRSYEFGLDLDQKDKRTGKSFRQRITTLAKLQSLDTHKTHLQQQKSNLEVYDFCPDCIIKIKQELNL